MTGSIGTNWAGTYSYGATAVLRPRHVDELRHIVRRGTPMRALGSRHSFNDLADTTGALVSLEAFPPGLEIDESTGTATFSAGLRYGDLADMLQSQGWALHNLASLPHISVAGAVATATHGSGDGNGNLATAVAAVELIDGAGDQVRLARGDADFEGAVVSLGAVRGLGDTIAAILHVTELRTVAADSLWLSGTYGTPALAIHFTWKKLPDEVSRVLSRIEDILLPLGARPHWGKVSLAMADSLTPLYPRFEDFRRLAQRYDPGGLFRNAYLARNLGL